MTNATETKTVPDFFVVGIGASAGGLRALEEFFENMPSDSGATFVVVQHLSPDHKSLMSELLERRTNMPVKRVTEQMALTPNTIFLIPPGQNLVVEDRRFHLIRQKRAQGSQPNFPIDLFFQSLSTESRENTISIVLSGTGSDGSRGIQEVAEIGGIVLAQDPATAEFDGMPQSAIATDTVDLVLSPSDLAQATYQFVTSPAELQAFRDDQKNQLAPTQLQQVIDIVEQYEDIDFTHYKPSSLTRRIQRRCMIAGYKSLGSYIEHLETSETERNALRNDLLITVTRFFRDTEAWQALERTVLPQLIEQAESTKTLRIWITACATGEEAYSMAMLLQELLEQHQPRIEAKIFATDIDQIALSKAAAGIYPAASAVSLGEDRLNRFFNPGVNNTYEVSRSLREMIIFAPHNLAKDASFPRMDLVSCRNVLIYMQPELQNQVLRRLHFALRAQGVLFLGESETLGAALENEFKPLHRKWKIYRKLRDVKLPLDTKDIAALSVRQLRLYPTSAKQPPRFDPLLETAFKALLSNRQVTCVLIDRQLQLLYVCGDALKLLKVPEGRVSTDVISLLPQSLQLPLSTALHRVCRGKQSSVQYCGCQLSEAEHSGLTVHLNVTQQTVSRTVGEFFMLEISQEKPPALDTFSSQFEADADTAQYVLQLERELQRTRENLQATVEELETTNEEQQATNEELIASNEELQSTNEELQSVNEELYTVNAEYQSKIQELVQTNNDLDNLLRNIDIGVIFLDSALRIRKFTAAATLACNLVDADINRPIAHLSHNLENFDLIDFLERVQTESSDLQQEVKLKQQGSYLLMRAHPYLTETDKVDGLVVAFFNIDDIKQTQQRLEAAEVSLRQTNEILEQQVQARTAELADSQHFLESITQATPNNVYIYDLLSKSNVYANRSTEALLGYSQADVQAMGADLNARILHPDDLAHIEAHHQAIMASDADDSVVFDVEYRVQDASGSWHWMYSQDVIFARAADGQPTQILGTAIDISDRKAAVDRLKKSEARYRSLYNSTPVMLHSINQAGELISVSDYWLKTLGYELSEVLGRKSMAFLTADSRQYAKEVVMPEFFKTGICTDVPYQMVCKDGRIREVLLSATTETDESGNFLRSLAVMVDVTERKQAEAELARYRNHLEELVKARAAELQETNQSLQAEVIERQQAQSELAKRAQALEQSNADLEQFAYVISHDLQEPLRAMTVFSQLLGGQYGDQLNATAQGYITHIIEGGIRMQALIDGILAFSRITHQGKTFEAVALEQVLAIALENLGVAIADTQATITHGELPTLNIDTNQIVQLFQNLIGNAIKFRGTEPPRIHIGAEQLNPEQKPDSWVFSIQDNGIGIPPDEQARTFALFQRLHTRQEKEGYGIGLAICKKIVERHHGRIWVDSEPGKGSTFYFTIATASQSGKPIELALAPSCQ
ncbi:MAG: CheR family methyltransferase [Cyanobacteria bacterium P01_A01_bin.114]